MHWEPSVPNPAPCVCVVCRGSNPEAHTGYARALPLSYTTTFPIAIPNVDPQWCNPDSGWEEQHSPHHRGREVLCQWYCLELQLHDDNEKRLDFQLISLFFLNSPQTVQSPACPSCLHLGQIVLHILAHLIFISSPWSRHHNQCQRSRGIKGFSQDNKTNKWQTRIWMLAVWFLITTPAALARRL